MKNKPKDPGDQEIARMESLWFEYERTQGRTAAEFEDQHPEVIVRTRLEEIWAWEDYAVQKYLKWIDEPAQGQLVGTPDSDDRRSRAYND